MSQLRVVAARDAEVGGVKVRRALPQRERRTVGAWCFADHFGPADVSEEYGFDVGPHPHIGLATVTWLFEGEVLHRDSLGSEQPIRAGELNLMTSGFGIAHAEETTGRYAGALAGIQLWLALPEGSRNGGSAFAHHRDLPQAELGTSSATVLVGRFAGLTSPAAFDWPTAGAEIVLRGGSADLPLDPAFEYALVVADGEVGVLDTTLGPGRLGYLGVGRDELHLTSRRDACVMLLGGVPFADRVVMWWNFVARSTEELDAAYAAWQAADARFGAVGSSLDRVPAPAPYWQVTRQDR
jgi:redox-sensitive bicupin YhaK (pirin superfamily)